MKTPTTLRMMVITLGGMLVLLAGVCGYQYLAAAAKGRAIDEQHKKLIVAKQQTATWAQAQADAKVVAATVIQRQAVWNWSEQLPVMVTSLSGMVKDCGIAIDTMQPAPMVESQQVARFPLHITMHTDLASLTKFFQRTQTAVPLFAIDQVAIHAGKAPGDPLLVEMTLSSYVMLDSIPATGGRS